jgi:aquaporin Z
MKNELYAEFLGTFFIVFVGTGAIIVDTITGSLTHIGVAIVWGIVVMAMIYTFSHISSAHFNPAVTISFLFLKEISLYKAFKYILAQFLGALTASGLLFYLFGNIKALGSTLPSSNWQQSFILEVILTFLLVTVILFSAYNKKANSALAGMIIGGIICLEAMFAGPISGASMNPARSFAPAIISGNTKYLWVYIIATILGGIIATYTYKMLYSKHN